MIFNPRDLRPISELCAEGIIPQAWRTIRDLARRKKFPAVKVGGEWRTTEELARAYYYKGANSAARRLAA